MTPLGLGCEAVKEPKLVWRAADLGITHFNCFPNRGDITHFPVVGKALRPVRSRVVLASGSSARTKAGLLDDLERQLKAFGTDHVDLYYLLAVSQAEVLTDELLEALETARRSGKIRAGALSTHGFSAILPRLRETTGFVKAVMVTCNFAAWDAGGWAEALPSIRELRQRGVGIVAMKSLLGGMGDPPAGRSALTETLKTAAGRRQVMAAALRWVLQNEFVDTVPVLAKSTAELEANRRAAAGALTASDRQLLTATVAQATPRLCRLCPRCMASCRAGLPVAELMRMLMYAEGYDDPERGQQAFAALEARLQTVRCHACTDCSARCPYGVNVRDRMSAAQSRLAPRGPMTHPPSPSPAAHRRCLPGSPSTRTSSTKSSPMKAAVATLILLLITARPPTAAAQSADWQTVIWREPQVRYLLADMTLGGNVGLYRDYATREKDPDSVEAIRLWDAGSRVVNTNDFERRWIINPFGKDGRVMRVVFRGTNRTIQGDEVLLTSDRGIDQAGMRRILLELTLGRAPSSFDPVRPGRQPIAEQPQRQPPEASVRSRSHEDPTVAEALRRWRAGVRVTNADWFAPGLRKAPGPNYRGTHHAADGTRVRLNSDLPYPETNVRYFMADIALGGSIEFYRAAAERDHEMGCREAVRRTEDGYRITNLDQFERKKVDGKTLITRKGSNERIRGMEIQLASD